MKTTFRALVLCGLASFASSVSAQGECSEAKKSECSTKAEATLASADGECSSSKEAKLAKAGGEECSSAMAAACDESMAKQCDKGAAKLASAGDGEACSSAKAAACDESKAKECGKDAAKLASAGGEECSTKAKAGECKEAAAKLAAAGDGQQCSSKEADKSAATLAKVVVPTSIKLSALIKPNRIAGVVVGGKAYLGPKAVAVIDGLLREQVGTKIASVCEESAKCSKTLATNVEKTLASGICVKTGFTGLLASGRIDSLIIENESTSGEAALASLTSVTSCPEYQAECQTLASAPAKGECSEAAKAECATKASASEACATKAAASEECATKASAKAECCSGEAKAEATQASAKAECSSTSTIQ
ncbi:MAG: hypothetical protein ACI87A_001205 [Planctomycetota bacterium]|jgi:hypothetical protein